MVLDKHGKDVYVYILLHGTAYKLTFILRGVSYLLILL